MFKTVGFNFESFNNRKFASQSIYQTVSAFVNWKKPLSHVEMYFFHKCNGINQGMYKNRVELGKVSKCYILTYLIFRFCHLYLLILKDIKEWGFQKSLLFFTLFYTYPGTIAIPDYLGSIDKSMHILQNKVSMQLYESSRNFFSAMSKKLESSFVKEN